MLIIIPGQEADILVREDKILIDEVKGFTLYINENEFWIHSYDDCDGTLAISGKDMGKTLQITPMTKGKIMIDVEEDKAE